LDTGAGNQLSEEKLYDALHHPELGIRDIAARLVVKHDSEWFGDGSHYKWKAFFQNYDRLCIDYAQKWLADMEWMSQVPAFSEGKPIWHMHPVVFLGALNQKRVLITLAMLRKIWVDSRYASNDTLQQVANELNANFYLCHLDTEYRLYHFMAQVRQETGANFSISENLNYAEPTLLNLFYYYRCHPKEAGVDGRTSTHAANQENIANKAYGGRNGNDRSGDGWLFRGQGLKQLTGRGNYREFTVYSKRTWRDSENYEINPRLISSNITLAVRTALYFWIAIIFILKPIKVMAERFHMPSPRSLTKVLIAMKLDSIT